MIGFEPTSPSPPANDSRYQTALLQSKTIDVVWGTLKNLIGRCDRIRTYDPFTPSEVRYQAALHTDRAAQFT